VLQQNKGRGRFKLRKQEIQCREEAKEILRIMKKKTPGPSWAANLQSNQSSLGENVGGVRRPPGEILGLVESSVEKMQAGM
jgi:hypothetical protein